MLDKVGNAFCASVFGFIPEIQVLFAYVWEHCRLDEYQIVFVGPIFFLSAIHPKDVQEKILFVLDFINSGPVKQFNEVLFLNSVTLCYRWREWWSHFIHIPSLIFRQGPSRSGCEVGSSLAVVEEWNLQHGCGLLGENYRFHCLLF